MKFEDFGKNVAKYRNKIGMSAYELSLQLGKDSSYISKLENGRINISLKMILSISEILKIALKNYLKKLVNYDTR